MIEIFKYSDHFSGTEYAGNSLYILITSLAQNMLGIYILNISILEYLWNSLNIPAFEYFLLFTV